MRALRPSCAWRLALVASLLLCSVLSRPASSRAADGGFFGWDEDPPAPVEADPWARATIRRGERLFRGLCSGCHGFEGKGDGVAAKTMFPAPRDLSRGEYKFRTTRSGALPTRDDLLRTLRLGLPGTEMPAWGPQIGERGLRSLVLYIETLSERFDEGRRDTDVLVQMDELRPPEVSDELLARGAGIYARMKCAQCHGEQGRGDGPAAAQYRREKGSTSEVFDFSWGLYRGGDRLEDLYRTFVTGLDGTPMPSYIDSLPEEQDRWALAAFVRSLTRRRGLGFYLIERPRWNEPMSAPAREDAP